MTQQQEDSASELIKENELLPHEMLTTEETLPFDENIQKKNPAVSFDDIVKNAQTVLSFVVGTAAVLTASGFVIVNTHLARYTNVHGYNISPTQYLTAGIGLWVIVLIVAAIQGLVNFRNPTKDYKQLIREKLLFVIPTLMILGISLISTVITGVISGAEIASFTGAMLFTIVTVIPTILRTIWRHGYIAGIAVWALAAGVLYGRFIYSEIPRYLGGGALVPVSILFKDGQNIQQLGFESLPGQTNATYQIKILAELTDGLLVYNEHDPIHPYAVIVKSDMIDGIIDEHGAEHLVAISTVEPTPEVTPEVTATP